MILSVAGHSGKNQQSGCFYEPGAHNICCFGLFYLLGQALAQMGKPEEIIKYDKAAFWGARTNTVVTA